MAQVVDSILDLMDRRDVNIVEDPSRIRPANSEVMKLISNNSYSFELCGWQPQYGLREGLSETIEWVKSNYEQTFTGKYYV